MSQITPQNWGLVQQANQPAQKIVGVIDVLAGEGDYVAAFEVKHTSSLHSSLLRMSNLLAPEPICVCDSTWLHPTDAEDVELSNYCIGLFELRDSPVTLISVDRRYARTL